VDIAWDDAELKQAKADVRGWLSASLARPAVIRESRKRPAFGTGRPTRCAVAAPRHLIASILISFCFSVSTGSSSLPAR
jgi:hypothetical protein